MAGTGCRPGSGAPAFESTAASYVGATAADLCAAAATNFRAGARSGTRSRRRSRAATTRAESRTHRRSAWGGTSTTPAETAPASPATTAATSTAAPTATATAPSQHEEIRTQK